MPDQVILRLFNFYSLETFDAALAQADRFAKCKKVSDPKDRDRSCSLGAYLRVWPTTKCNLRTYFISCERGDLENPDEIKVSHYDYEDLLVHQTGHALIVNRFRSNYIIGGPPVMPWLSEGMAAFMTIKHLGTRNLVCIEPTEKENRYAQQGKEEKKRSVSLADLEELVTRVALEDTADSFEDMIRITTYRNLNDETLSRAFSTIDFLLEYDRIGFLRFLDALQKHYKQLFVERSQSAFLGGLDGLVAEAFVGDRPLDSVEALEEAWKAWASQYVRKGRPQIDRK
jgi:hypothetical protein